MRTEKVGRCLFFGDFYAFGARGFSWWLRSPAADPASWWGFYWAQQRIWLVKTPPLRSARTTDGPRCLDHRHTKARQPHRNAVTIAFLGDGAVTFNFSCAAYFATPPELPLRTHVAARDYD